MTHLVHDGDLNHLIEKRDREGLSWKVISPLKREINWLVPVVMAEWFSPGFAYQVRSTRQIDWNMLTSRGYTL